MNMRFFIIAAAATLLAACTQENEVQNNPVEARITAGVSGPKTRAVDNGWNADRIGVMVVDAPGTTTTMGGKYKNVGYATTSTGTNADFTPMTAGGGIFFEDAFLEFTFAAYAPYASGANASTLPGTDGKITVNTSNQPTTTEQEKVDYIHATGAKADKDSPTVSFTDNTAAGGSDCSFKHKMARLILKVQVSNTDGFDDTAVLEFADYKLGGLVHEGTFDVKTGTAGCMRHSRPTQSFRREKTTKLRDCAPVRCRWSLRRNSRNSGKRRLRQLPNSSFSSHDAGCSFEGHPFLSRRFRPYRRRK